MQSQRFYTANEAVCILHAMFPDQEKETIAAILDKTNNNLNTTIEIIQKNEDDLIAASLDDPDDKNDGTDPMYRGCKIELPEDFLRPPSYSLNLEFTTVLDENMISVLQNHVGSKEVQNSGVKHQPSLEGGAPYSGIMKSLTTAKKSFSMFAERFSQPSSKLSDNSGHGFGSFSFSSMSSSSSSSSSSFSVPSSGDPRPSMTEDEEDENEIISFDINPLR